MTAIRCQCARCRRISFTLTSKPSTNNSLSCQLDAVIEFTTAREKGRWCLSVSSSGSVLQEGLFIESSLILPMPVPHELFRPAFKAAIASDPLL